MSEHEVTISSQVYYWDATEVVVSCSCGATLLDEMRERPFDEVRAVVHDHLASAITEAA